jgi:hypothetical protein
MDPLLETQSSTSAPAAAPAPAPIPDASNMEAHIMPGMSKYDFVKIRVHLGSHYYVLSRFLVSRMLQVLIAPLATFGNSSQRSSSSNGPTLHFHAHHR